MRALRNLVIACVLAPNLACSEGSLSPTTVTQSRELSGAGASTAACSGGVFSDTLRQGDVDHTRTLGLIRLRSVEVDLAAVRRAADDRSPLTLNVFPDACLVAQVTGVDHDAQGNLVLTGATADAADRATFTLVAGTDFVIGSAVGNRALYQVRYAGNGVHVVMQINPAALPPD